MPLLKDQTKWVILKYQSLTCPTDQMGGSRLNFNMIHRDILLGQVSFMQISPRDSTRVTGSMPRQPGGRGPVTVYDRCGAGWCFCHKVFTTIMFATACSRMLRTLNPMPKQLDTSCTCEIRVQPVDFFDLVDLLKPY